MGYKFDIQVRQYVNDKFVWTTIIHKAFSMDIPRLFAQAVREWEGQVKVLPSTTK